MRVLAPLALPLFLALPVMADDILSEVTGNWSSSGDGFGFIARLTQVEDMARLQIWTSNPGEAPTVGGEPALDNPEISLAAFATRQELQVVQGDAGNVLQLVTEFADEEAEGQVVLELQFLDNQFTVVGYRYHETTHGYDGMAPVDYACELDFGRGVVVEDGVERNLPALDAEALNASGWSFGAAFDRGYCTPA